MCLTLMLVVGALLHIAFMAGEMLPWDKPFILAGVLKGNGIDFDGRQQKLVATIVHNAGIYNFILALGFVWCLFPGIVGDMPDEVMVKLTSTFFFSAAVVAGLFGLTLSSKTIAQAIVGIGGLVAVYLC